MASLDCLVAAVLLTSAPEVPASSEALAWAATCRAPLLALALDAQVIDPRERFHFLNDSQDTARDVKALQSRFQDFAFAPLAEEALRFPDRKTTEDFLAFNRDYQKHLMARLEIDSVNGVHLRLAMQETDQLHKVWCAVLDARRGYHDITVRRQALQLLRELIGDEAFYSGRLPPYVPVWRLPVER